MAICAQLDHWVFVGQRSHTRHREEHNYGTWALSRRIALFACDIVCMLAINDHALIAAVLVREVVLVIPTPFWLGLYYRGRKLGSAILRDGKDLDNFGILTIIQDERRRLFDDVVTFRPATQSLRYGIPRLGSIDNNRVRPRAQ